MSSNAPFSRDATTAASNWTKATTGDNASGRGITAIALAAMSSPELAQDVDGTWKSCIDSVKTVQEVESPDPCLPTATAISCSAPAFVGKTMRLVYTEGRSVRAVTWQSAVTTTSTGSRSNDHQAPIIGAVRRSSVSVMSLNDGVKTMALLRLPVWITATGPPKGETATMTSSRASWAGSTVSDLPKCFG